MPRVVSQRPLPNVTVAVSDYLVTIIVGDTHLTMTADEARHMADSLFVMAREAEKNR